MKLRFLNEHYNFNLKLLGSRVFVPIVILTDSSPIFFNGSYYPGPGIVLSFGG